MELRIVYISVIMSLQVPAVQWFSRQKKMVPTVWLIWLLLPVRLEVNRYVSMPGNVHIIHIINISLNWLHCNHSVLNIKWLIHISIHINVE